MKATEAIRILEDLKASTLNIATDYDEALEEAIHALTVRAVAQNVAEQMVRTVRSDDRLYDCQWK